MFKKINFSSKSSPSKSKKSFDSQKKLKKGVSSSSLLKTKLKYLGGFLGVLLLVIGGSVGYYLVQQRGVGDVRQQASTAGTSVLFEDFETGELAQLPEGWTASTSNSSWGEGWGEWWGIDMNNFIGYFF